MQQLVQHVSWPATRDAAHHRLASFVPLAGSTYAARRNHDFGPANRSNVSGLSPYIRHRLMSESEVVAIVLATHSASAAEKFIQEVCWRTYWKGWLEQRPQVWDAYLNELSRSRSDLRDDAALAAEIAAAETGNTGVACFDAWVHELVETGYLHNHARMWFASIWIFTLRLPWALGADFFIATYWMAIRPPTPCPGVGWPVCTRAARPISLDPTTLRPIPPDASSQRLETWSWLQRR